MQLLRDGICPITNKPDKLLYSNSLIAPIGLTYLESQVDYRNLLNADKFCRTYDIPFDPNMWIKAIRFEDGKNILYNYVKHMEPKIQELQLKYKTSTESIWKEVNTEWEKGLTHKMLLDRIGDVKELFIERASMQWGPTFTFDELIRLENQFQSTMQNFEISNPLQIDAVKKAAITSVKIDRIMTSDGDVRELKDLATAYQTFAKLAKIDEMLETSETDVIRTVADLSRYLEENGFEFKFYDNVERDIVDRTINDLKLYTKTLVMESTGLDETLHLITKKLEEQKQSEADLKAFAEKPLDLLISEAREKEQAEIDEELSKESIFEDFMLGDYDEDDF